MKAAMPAPEPLASYASRTAARARSAAAASESTRDQRWLVGHQGCHVVGIGRHERERGHRTATASEHLDRAGAERLDDGVYVVRLNRGRIVDPAVLANAAAEAARVIGDHGPVREMRRQRVEAAGVHRLTDHEQRWAYVGGGQRATDVIGDVCPGGFEHVRCHATTTAPPSKTHRALAEGTARLTSRTVDPSLPCSGASGLSEQAGTRQCPPKEVRTTVVTRLTTPCGRLSSLGPPGRAGERTLGWVACSC